MGKRSNDRYPRFYPLHDPCSLYVSAAAILPHPASSRRRPLQRNVLSVFDEALSRLVLPDWPPDTHISMFSPSQADRVMRRISSRADKRDPAMVGSRSRGRPIHRSMPSPAGLKAYFRREGNRKVKTARGPRPGGGDGSAPRRGPLVGFSFSPAMVSMHPGASRASTGGTNRVVHIATSFVDHGVAGERGERTTRQAWAARCLARTPAKTAEDDSRPCVLFMQMPPQ